VLLLIKPMSSLVNFVKESVEEMRTKVTWPKYRDLQQSSILVLVASLIFALAIFGVDNVFQFIMDNVYKGF